MKQTLFQKQIINQKQYNKDVKNYAELVTDLTHSLPISPPPMPPSESTKQFMERINKFILKYTVISITYNDKLNECIVVYDDFDLGELIRSLKYR